MFVTHHTLHSHSRYPHLFSQSQNWRVFFLLFLPPFLNLSLFMNCTTWHGSTVTNVQAEGLIISCSFWCWFCNQTDQSALQMSGFSVIWVKQRELSQHFCCGLLNTSNSGRELLSRTLSTGGCCCCCCWEVFHAVSDNLLEEQLVFSQFRNYG